MVVGSSFYRFNCPAAKQHDRVELADQGLEGQASAPRESMFLLPLAKKSMRHIERVRPRTRKRYLVTPLLAGRPGIGHNFNFRWTPFAAGSPCLSGIVLKPDFINRKC